MRALLLLIGGLLLALPASAQSTRSFIFVPVNFRNDVTQPRTLTQLRTDATTLATRIFGTAQTYGAVTTTTTVVDYLTVDMDKGCPGNAGVLPVLNMSEFLQKVTAGLAARGQSVSGYTYVYYVSPTTFSKCSHTGGYRYLFDYSAGAEEAAVYLAWSGLGRKLSLNWACRAGALGTPEYNTFVTRSAFCGPSPSTANGRDITSFTGQGGRPFTAYDRNALGWLPAAQQFSVPTTTTSGQWTIRRLEDPTAGVLKRLQIPTMGIELTYLGIPGQFGWDYRGVTGHLINTSQRLDFTPDDCWLFCTTALAPPLSWTYNGLTLTAVSIDANVAVVKLAPAGVTPPPGTPVNCVVSAWSAFGACVNGLETRSRTVVTPASNGGTACPALVETQACIADPLPPGVQVVSLTPADGSTTRSGQPITMSVTVFGAAVVEGHWLIGAQDNHKSVTRVGDTYAFTESPQSLGTRKFYFLFRGPTGLVLDKTPQRTITVTP